MNLNKSLAQIIGLLSLPSLILGWLWLSQTYRELQGLTSAMTGLKAIGEIWRAAPLIGQQDPSGRDTFEAAYFDPQTHQFLKSKIEEIRTQESLTAGANLAARVMSDLALTHRIQEVFADSQPSSANLLAEGLPEVLERSLRFADQARRLALTNTRNNWDRMALGVAGGQLKLAADHVIANSLGAKSEALAPFAASLEVAARSLRRSALSLQASAGEFLLEAIEKDNGEILDPSKIIKSQDTLKEAIGNYWALVYANATRDLENKQSQLRQLFALAIVTGVFLITTCVALAISLGRALAVKTAAQFLYQQTHDRLTGLCNRQALVSAMEASLQPGSISTSDPPSCGLVCLDIAGFKAANDSHGDAFGDAILLAIRDDLVQMSGTKGIISRIGGDEFAIFFGSDFPSHQCYELAQALLRRIGRHRRILNEAVNISVHLGVVTGPRPGEGAEQWLKNAELALREAKRHPLGGICLFDDAMRRRFDGDFAMAGELKEALKLGQIVPFFQPQVCTVTGMVTGFEALARWIGDDGQPISPGQFLPAAELAGLGGLIDETIRKQSMSAMARWRQNGFDIGHIGLNVRADELEEEAFCATLASEAEAEGLTLDRIAIEVLETVAVDGANAERVRAQVAELAENGALIELDDFGTGHAGLSSLRQLRVNVVKIDRSFVSDVDSKPQLQVLTRALIDLARNVGVRVLAEGVETEAERNWLSENHCDMIQGYLIARPMPFDRASQWLNEYQTLLASEPAGPGLRIGASPEPV